VKELKEEIEEKGYAPLKHGIYEYCINIIKVRSD
jgi:hypothetical protein